MRSVGGSSLKVLNAQRRDEVYKTDVVDGAAQLPSNGRGSPAFWRMGLQRCQCCFVQAGRGRRPGQAVLERALGFWQLAPNRGQDPGCIWNANTRGRPLTSEKPDLSASATTA